MAGQMWPAGEPGVRKSSSKQAKAFLSLCLPVPIPGHRGLIYRFRALFKRSNSH